MKTRTIATLALAAMISATSAFAPQNSILPSISITASAASAHQYTQAEIEQAIKWAYEAMNGQHPNPRVGSNGRWEWWCLGFVSDAYKSAGIYLPASYNTAQQAANVMVTNTDKDPPRGAFVFYRYGTDGHVAISLGDRSIIHADADGIKVTGLDLPGRTYIGYGAWGSNHGYSISSSTSASASESSLIQHGSEVRISCGGQYLNLYGGYNYQGNKYVGWSEDGSSEQVNILEYCGNGKFRLRSKAATNRCLDVYRKYVNGKWQILPGCSVDLYDPNDAAAQEFKLERVGNQYKIVLAAYPNLALTLKGSWNGAAITVENYTGSSNQLWDIQR